MSDLGTIGEWAALFIEQLSDAYGEDVCIRSLAIVAEVERQDATEILVTCSEDRSWVCVGLLNEAIYSVEDQIKARSDED